MTAAGRLSVAAGGSRGTRLPDDWSERARAHESQVSGEREAVLPFISRRHARPELDEVLVARAFPVPTPQVVRSARPVSIPVGWPVGAPPPPIRVQQLWGLDGIGATIAGRDPVWTRHPVGLPFRATVIPTVIWTTIRKNLDDSSMSPTTIRRKPKQRKTTTPELPKKGRLQSSTAKMTRAICVLAVRGPSCIWRDPMTEICALQLTCPVWHVDTVSFLAISASLHQTPVFVKSHYPKGEIAPSVPKTKLVCRRPACASVPLSVSYPRSALSRSAHFYINISI